MRIMFGYKQSSDGSDYNITRNRSSSFGGLIERRCLAPLTLDEDEDVNEELLVRNNSYYRLSQEQLLKLSVLKLDGSLFDVHVRRNANVAQLKQAVEDVFTTSMEECQEEISWTSVWGHFCLCYNGRKLINDKASIRNFGIKDGDQLQFIRHMSICYSPARSNKRTRVVLANHGRLTGMRLKIITPITIIMRMRRKSTSQS